MGIWTPPNYDQLGIYLILSQTEGKALSSGKKEMTWACVRMSTALLWLLCCYFCSFLLAGALTRKLLIVWWYATSPCTCAFIIISGRKQSLNINLSWGKHICPTFHALVLISFLIACPIFVSHLSQWSGQVKGKVFAELTDLSYLVPF